VASPASDFAVLLTTAGSDEQAREIARTLVTERLAACVNVVPGVASTYRWKGEVVTDAEHLLVVKTRRALFARLRETIRRVHAYELPELLVLPVADGDPDYLAWLAESSGG
jgi:periplasmic divalent cation tolerance protein